MLHKGQGRGDASLYYSDERPKNRKTAGYQVAKRALSPFMITKR